MSSITVSSLPDELQSPLSQLTRRIAMLAVVRGLGRFLCMLAIVLATALFSDFLFDWSSGFRRGWLIVLGVSALGGLWWFVFRPLRRSMSPTELAALIELHYPHLHERLTATIELNDPTIPEAHKGSAVMRELVRREALGSLPALNVTQALPTERTKRALMFGLLAVVLLAVPFALSPRNYSLLWARLLQPEGNFANASNLYFVIEDPDRVVARGTDVEISAEPKWRYIGATLPDSVWLNRVDDDGNTDRRRMELDDETGNYVGTFPHVHKDFEYFLTAESSTGETHRIGVVDSPEIAKLEVQDEPPAYTGLPAKTYTTASGRLTSFERSRISLALTFNKPIESLEFEWDVTARSIDANPHGPKEHLPVPEIELSADRSSAKFSFLAEIEGPYSLKLTDEIGLHNLQDPPRSIAITRDQPPKVNLKAGGLDQMKARSSDMLRVPVDVVDDIGVGEIELHLSLPDNREEVIPADSTLLGVPSLTYQLETDLSQYNLKEGDVVSWRIRTADERPIPEPNVVWTSPRTLAIDNSAASLAQAEVEKRQAEWKAQLENLRQQLEANAKIVKDLETDARQSEAQNKPFERDKEIGPLSEQQQELAGRMESLSREFAEHPLFNKMTGILERLAREELGPLGEQLADVQAKPLTEKPDELQQNQEGVREVAEQLKQLEQSFDQLAEIEKDLLELDQLSDDARKLADKAAELNRQQRELSEQLETNPELAQNTEFQQQSQQLQQEFDQLAQDQQRLTDELRDLLQKRPELVDAARQKEVEQLKELARQARELAEPQEQLAEQLEAAAEQTASRQEQAREQQKQLRDELENLLAEADRKAQEAAVPPLDHPASDEAEQALQQGDLQTAAEKQAELAEELKRLAEQLKQSAPLPADPKEALEELARREDQLQQEMKQAAGQDPTKQTAAERAAESESLARKQEALQQALEQLPLPKEQEPQREAAAKSAEQATQELMQGNPEQASEQAKQSAQQMRDLASALPENAAEQAAQNQPMPPDPKQVAQQARELARQAGELQQQTEALAQSPEQPNAQQQQEEIQNRQSELQKEVSQLSPEVGRFPRAEAMQSLKQAQQNLEQNQLAEAAQQQANAKESLEEIAERAEALSRSEQNPEMSPEQVSEQLQQLAEHQQELQQQTQSQANEQSLNPEQQQAAQQQLDELQTRQEALASEAAEMALQAAREQGPAAPETQQAIESARQANQAGQQLENGQLAAAAQSAQQAAKSAEQSSQQAASQNPDSELSAKEKDFANRQSELANELSGLAQNPSTSSQAQQQGQQQRGQQARELASRFEQASQRIQSDPFNLGEESEQAQQASQSSQQAAQNMQQASQNQARQNSGQAARQASQAAQQLQQAAEGILPREVPESPVPEQVGEQVADAFQDLMNAQQALQKMMEQAKNAPGQSGSPSKGESDPTAGKDPSGQQGEKGEPGQPLSEAEQKLAEQALEQMMEQMLQEMNQAANSLQQASNQMQPGKKSQTNGQPPNSNSQQPGEPGEPGGEQSNDSGQLPPGSDLAMEQLELELKNLKSRNWGQLPGKLRTEILQSQKKNPNADYARHIKLYFEEIAKQQSTDRARRNAQE